MHKHSRFFIGPLCGAIVISLDFAMRRASMSSWTFTDSRIWALSALSSMAFWTGLSWVAGAMRPVLRALLLSIAGLAVLLPWLNVSHYGVPPNRAALQFFASHATFVLSGAKSLLKIEDVAISAFVIGLVATLGISTPVVGRRWRVLAVLAIIAHITVPAVSTMPAGVPLTPEATTFHGLQHFSVSQEVQKLKRSGVVVSPFEPPDHAYSVLWIVAETLAAEQIDKRPEIAPHLVRLKDDPSVIWLSQLESNASCTDVSVPSLLTSVRPSASEERILSAPTIFDVMAQVQYQTALYGSARLTWGGMSDYLVNENVHRAVGAEHLDFAASDDTGVRDSRIYARVLNALTEDVKRPKLIVLQTNTTHPPYQVDEDVPWFDRNGSGELPKYQRSVFTWDRMFGQFWDALSRLPDFDNLIVIFTADHGEAFGAHGITSHCGSFFPDESWVPGFIRLPSVLVDGEVHQKLKQRADEPSMNTDLLPTILSILKIDPQLTFDGQSLVAPRQSERPQVFTNCSELHDCYVPSFGVAHNDRRWHFDGSSKLWRNWPLRDLEARLPSAGTELPPPEVLQFVAGEKALREIVQ